MKSRDLIIATTLFIFFSSLLSGCQVIQPNNNRKTAQKTVIEELVMKAVAAKKEVKLHLKADHQGKQVKVAVTLDNPNLKPVTSVQTWLSYNPATLKGVSVDTKDSSFSLMAPYNNSFDEKNGLVMLGRANPDPLREKSVKVAELTFEVIGTGSTMIDAYDYQEDLSGHTSANVMVSGKPFNILVKPESPALVIE